MADSREVAQRYADLFMQRFSEIDSDSWKKPWISSTASPMNITGREYRRSNRLLLAFLCEKMGWKLPVFLTWQQASKLDVCVQKGQKSFPVVWFREWYEKDGKKVYTTDVVAERFEFCEKKADANNNDDVPTITSYDDFMKLPQIDIPDEEFPFN